MAIREDIVASATQFLQDPSVTNSSMESRVAFLRTKNLTQEEIDAAFSRVDAQPVSAAGPGPIAVAHPQQQQQQQRQQQQQQQQQQPYYQPYPPKYAEWQPPPPPGRDWRDWFIMATVIGGVGYSAYTLVKRYVYPLIAPPTPERLEQDKKSIQEQFDRAFGLVEQLAKDTEELKAAEQERTEKLDAALTDLESVIQELRSSNTRREMETQRVKDDIQGLKDSMPRAMNGVKDLTDARMKEVNSELTSLKTLITQRMNAATSSVGVSGRRTGGNATSSPLPGANGHAATGSEGQAGNAESGAESETAETTGTPSYNRVSPFHNASLPLGGGTGAKVSIPAWQMAMANKDKDSVVTSTTPNATETSSSSKQQPAETV